MQAVFKLDLIFTTTGKALQMRQFTSNMLDYLKKNKISLLPPRAVQECEWGKFRRFKCGSSGALAKAV
jgi:hypothetical protein